MVRCLLASIALLALPSRALAHPLLDEAARRYAEADFAGAIEAFAQAEASNDLSREDLIALYTSRSLVRFAMQEIDAVEEDLTRLATLDPDLEVPPDMPPAMQEMFARVKERIRTAIAVEGRVERVRNGLRVRAEVTGDVMGIVRDVAVHGRAGGAAWEHGADGELFVQDPSVLLQWYVEAIGPGGAVVANHGAQDAPLVREPPRAVPARPSLDDAVAEESDSGAGWWIAGGAVVAVAAIVTVVLVTSAGAETSRFAGPTVSP